MLYPVELRGRESSDSGSENGSQRAMIFRDPCPPFCHRGPVRRIGRRPPGLFDRCAIRLSRAILVREGAEQHEAMQKLASDSSAATGTTNLGALLKAKMNQQG